MTLQDLLSSLRQRGVRLRADGDRLHCQAPPGALTPELRSELARQRDDLLAFLRSATADDVGPPLRRLDRGQALPLSFAQQRLWFLDKLEPDLAAYNVASACRLKGPLQVEALERALRALGARHETLRTTFASDEGSPVQLVAPQAGIELPVVDLAGWSSEDRDRELSSLLAQEAARPFDLARGPLWRARLYRLGPDEHVLLQCLHHIVSDAWSLVVLFRELGALYAAYSAGQAASLPELPVQYADYAQWQRESLRGQKLEQELSYWRRKLEGLPTLELPTDGSRPPLQSFAGGKQRGGIPPLLAERLKDLSRREGVTLFMTLLAAFQVLLARHCGQEDVVVGTPIAGRNWPELEGLIGFFVNTLVLRTDLSGDPSFVELLSRVRQTALEAYAHQEVPFEKLVEELHPERDLSRNPLFQVLINMSSFGDDRTMELPGITVEPRELPDSTAKFDLTLYAKEEGGAIRLALAYNAHLFTPARMTELLDQYQALLRQIVEMPERHLSHFDLVTARARPVLPDARAILARRSTGLVHARIARPAGGDEGRPAVVDCSGVLTYRELHDRSNRLAKELHLSGIRSQDIVAIHGQRGASLVWALLGVLKAGGAFSILDPTHPAGRRIQTLRLVQPRGWLETEGAGVLEPELEQCLGELSLRCRWRLSARNDAPAEVPLREPETDAGADDLAYVAFTSGTTGGVKGILGTHRPLVHFLEWHSRTFGLSSADRFSMLSGLSHDPLLRDIFMPLWLGARLSIPEPESITDPDYLLQWLRSEEISVAHLTPALAQLLCQSNGESVLASLRYVFFGGDRLKRSTLERFRRLAPSATFVNFYGATETPQAMSYHVVSGEREEAPIGRGIDDAQLLVLNHACRLAGVGELGEIHVRTPYLSLGYLGDEPLTRERFITNPFTGAAEDRLYRTGDLARYLPDGNVDFCGRRDSQLKIRGFRIEPGEVEAALARHPGIGSVVVVAREDVPDDKRLVAYLVSAGSEKPTAGELRGFLGQGLPEYLVPSAFVWLKSIPLSPNGKLNRSALPAPEGGELAGGHEGPRTATAELLEGIWAQVLGVSQVGLHENFFELGGHSLLATQVISRVRSALGVELPLRALFEAPSVSGLAARVEAIRAQQGALGPPIVRGPRDGELELSFAQQRLWFLEQIEPSSAAYLLAFGVEMRGPLNVEALRRALETLMLRHESLRTSFRSVDGNPVQVIGPVDPVLLPVTQLGSEAEARMRLGPLIADELERPFDLTSGALLRTGLYRLAEEDHVLLIAVHHIACDGWSMGVFVRELGTLYEVYSKGQEASLPELPVQYTDFARWQRAWLSGETLEGQLSYWRRRLQGSPQALEVPTDRPRPAMESHRGARYSFPVSETLRAGLEQLSREQGVTLFMTLLGAFQVLLSRYCGHDDIVVGSPIAGRNRAELEGLIGLFVNTLVLRTDLSGDPSFRELLGRVRETALGAYAHQELPFEKLVEQLRPDRDLSRNPVFQVMFGLQNAPQRPLSLHELQVSPLEIERRTAQLDLSLHVRPTGEGGLKGTFEYSTDLFEKSTIERMAEHYACLLEGAVSGPGRRISQLPLLTESEQRRVWAWNSTDAEYPKACVHELISEQVLRAPERMALEFGEEALTYAELEERSDRLAKYLKRLGVVPEVRVGILLERSLDLVVGVLGILKAGGAYVPLDPSYPAERLAYMLEDSRARLVLSREELAQALPKGVRVVTVAMAEEGDVGGEVAGGALPENLAYVLYTSGSTGKPKGVSVTHRSLVNLLTSMGREPGVTELDVWLSVTTLSFDIAGLELYLPLLKGGRVVLASREEASDGVRLLSRLQGCGATVMQATPWSWRLLLEAGWQGSPGLKALCGGEALSRELANELLSRADEVWNLYGPTETTIWSSAWRVAEDSERMSIGRPLSNTRMFVLDGQLRPLPVGVPGDLYIGGAGLARGYWRSPELTAQSFVPDPFGAEAGGRLYRTGDRARWLADGRLECLGRLDQQVKLRGFRIELAEIETALRAHVNVGAAAVLALDSASDDRQLVAYVARHEAIEPNVSELRAYLKERLPSHMIPPTFVLLDELPVTPNGKLDRRELAEVYKRSVKSWRTFIPPRTPTEAFIAQLWQEALGVEQISVHDNFFDLGGHSMLAMRVLAGIERRVGFRLNPREIIFQTLEQLAARCDEPAEAEARASAPRGPVSRLFEAVRGAVIKARERAES